MAGVRRRLERLEEDALEAEVERRLVAEVEAIRECFERELDSPTYRRVVSILARLDQEIGS